MFEGLPEGIDILKLIEQNAQSDAELDKHFDIYDVCSKERGESSQIYVTLFILLVKIGADECETAAKVFKCGVDKDAAAMTTLIGTSAASAGNEASVNRLHLKHWLYF